jgi:hypothetical protein
LSIPGQVRGIQPDVPIARNRITATGRRQCRKRLGMFTSLNEI